MRIRGTWVGLIALGATACFGSHGGTGLDAGPRVDGAAPGFDAGPRRDAGDIDAAGFDAGPPFGFDAGPPFGFDAGPRRDGGRPFDAGRRPDAGPPPRDAGPPRPALRFRPGTGFVVEDSFAFDARLDNAYELWVRPRSAADADFCRKGGGTARHLVVGQSGGLLFMGWEVAGVSYHVFGPPLPLDVWTHAAYSARVLPTGDHEVTLFVNGAPVTTEVFPRLADAFNDVGFRCGGSEVDIDEIRVWRVARSASDVAATWRTQLPTGVPGMVAYYRLDESGQILIDYAAGSHPGVLGRLTTPDPADGQWILDGPI